MLGRLSGSTISLARARGIPILSGSVRPTDKRIIIFYRQYPGAHKSGYGLRSRIVWWLHTNEVIKGSDFNIHHRNGIRQDDRIGNLEKLSQREHSIKHATKEGSQVTRKCHLCQRDFIIERWRLKEKSRGRFCSQDCYHSYPKSDMTRKAQSASLKRAYQEGKR